MVLMDESHGRNIGGKKNGWDKKCIACWGQAGAALDAKRQKAKNKRSLAHQRLTIPINRNCLGKIIGRAGKEIKQKIKRQRHQSRRRMEPS